VTGDEKADEHAGQHRGSRQRLDCRNPLHRHELQQSLSEFLTRLDIDLESPIDGVKAGSRIVVRAQPVQSEQVLRALASLPEGIFRRSGSSSKSITHDGAGSARAGLGLPVPPTLKPSA
jgi:hypothetical protein